MIINIKTSKANQEVVSILTQKLPGNQKENIIARIALGYSLSLGKRFTQAEFNVYDSQGKEYKDSILYIPMGQLLYNMITNYLVVLIFLLKCIDYSQNSFPYFSKI